jgi:hypothetical protein
MNSETGVGELPKVKYLKLNLLVARVSALKLMVLTAAVVLLAASAAQAGTVTTFVAFDPAKNELGENLVFDQNNNLFVSMVLTNEVRKITPDGIQSAYATKSPVESLIATPPTTRPGRTESRGLRGASRPVKTGDCHVSHRRTVERHDPQR